MTMRKCVRLVFDPGSRQKHITRTLVASLASLASVLLPTCSGQGLPGPLDFAQSGVEGLRIYNISTFFGYSAFDFLPTGGSPLKPTANSRRTYGALGSIGWQRFHGRTNFSFRYSGSYTGDLRDTNLNRLG